MSQQPDISVLLPVYNAERFLASSIQSILNQSFRNFELIILNDGSTDASEHIIQSFKDPRIVYVSHPNRGLAATLNRGLELAKAAIIARQDNDDVSLPNRFQAQYTYLTQHPEVILLGTAAEIISEKGEPTGRFHKHPTQDAELRFHLLFNNPFVHSSVMFRKEAVIQAGAYSTDTSVFEDFDLWSRLSYAGKLSNLPDTLVHYREVSAGMSKSTADYDQRVRTQMLRNLRRQFRDLSMEELERFSEAMTGQAAYLENPMLEREVMKMIKRIKDEYLRQCPGQKDLVLERVKRLTLNYRRFVYNYTIHSDKAGALQKFTAKVKRKLLFTFNPGLN